MAKRNNKRAQPSEAHDLADWYEQCVESLLRKAGFAVQREPNIAGKTPDLLVTRKDDPDVIIECFTKLSDPERTKELVEQGHSSRLWHVDEMHGTLYSRLEQKITKYRELSNQQGYVIALYDSTLNAHPDTAEALAFSARAAYITLSADRQVIDRGYRDLWSTTGKSASLFKLHPHLSGLIYSCWRKEHYYLPNPFADVHISAGLFPFACVPEAPIIDGTPAWQERAPLVADDYVLPPNTWWGQVERLVQVVTQLIEHRRR